MTYKEQLRTFEWRLRSLMVMKRDGMKCVKCGASNCILEVHHKKYHKDLMAWEYPDKYLETLCDKCHYAVHANTPAGDFWNNMPLKIKKFTFSKKVLALFG